MRRWSLGIGTVPRWALIRGACSFPSQASISANRSVSCGDCPSYDSYDYASFCFIGLLARLALVSWSCALLSPSWFRYDILFSSWWGRFTVLKTHVQRCSKHFSLPPTTESTMTLWTIPLKLMSICCGADKEKSGLFRHWSMRCRSPVKHWLLQSPDNMHILSLSIWPRWS